MKSILQKKRVAEKSLNIISDITRRYIDMFELPLDAWDSSHKLMVFLNCDMEVMNYLEEKNIELHESVYEIGLTFGISVMKQEICRGFTEKYGPDISMGEKELMYNILFKHIYEFIVGGTQ